MPMLRTIAVLALALLSLALIGPAEDGLHAQVKKRVEVYSLPTEVDGTDFGRDDLLDYVSTHKLDARRITETIFKDYTLIGMADVLRTRVLSTELTRLNKQIDKVNLINLVASSTSAEALAADLDEQSVSASEIIRELADVFNGEGVDNLRDQIPYYPKETIAYWLGDIDQGAQTGYNERYLLARLKESATTQGRPGKQVSITQRMRDLEDLWEDETQSGSDDDDQIWRDQIQKLSLVEQLELYFGLVLRDDEAVLRELYDQANLSGKHLTSETLRAFELGDPAVAASVLEAEGLGNAATFNFGRVFEDMIDEDGVEVGEALIARLRGRLNAQRDWLRTVGDDVEAVYVGRTAGSIGTPSLGKLEEGGWESAADRGATRALLDYFAVSPNAQLVRYTNNSVRALIAGVRYEGLLDESAGTLTLQPVYGGTTTFRYEDLALHADGLILEMEVAERTEARRTLFRRTRRY